MTNILVDTNLLVYAYDPRDEAKHERAQQVLQRLCRSRRGVISVQSLAKFMRASQKLAMSPDNAGLRFRFGSARPAKPSVGDATCMSLKTTF